VCFFEFTSDRWNRRLVPHRVVVAALLEIPAVAKIDEAAEHCGFEEVANGRTSVPFTVNDTSAQSLMLRLFVA
jgi:hypothetical protein